jgi:hypothetical protein
VTNSVGGVIESELDTAIRTGGQLTLRNRPGSVIKSKFGDAVSAGVSLDAGNDGLIESQFGSALSATSDATIRNRFSGVIRSTGQAPAIQLEAINTVENAGAITAAQTAIAQESVGLTLTNRRRAVIQSTAGRAVMMRDGAVVNEEDAEIEGALGALRMTAGRVENAGHIVARSGPAIAVERGPGSAGALVIENSGGISGMIGIDVARDSAAPVEIFNSGRIEGTGGVAMRLASDRKGVLLDLSGDSAILGDVLFGGANDTLRIGDLTSGVLINSVFDGDDGVDLADFKGYGADSVLDVASLGSAAVALTLLAPNGDRLTGAFANFETFRFDGVDVAFADLGRLAPTPVPTPAAAPLLMVALISMVVAARRRNRCIHRGRETVRLCTRRLGRRSTGPEAVAVS